MGDDAAVSCLGLLTMIADYGVQNSAAGALKSTPAASESMTVTTRAVLPLTTTPGATA